MVSLVWYVTAFARFGVREQFKQQGAKSVNGPSSVCSLYSFGRGGVHTCTPCELEFQLKKNVSSTCSVVLAWEKHAESEKIRPNVFLMWLFSILVISCKKRAFLD
jgi:hypothetical protein